MRCLVNEVAVVVDSRGFSFSHRSWIVKNTSVEGAVIIIFCTRGSKYMEACICLVILSYMT